MKCDAAVCLLDVSQINIAFGSTLLISTFIESPISCFSFKPDWSTCSLSNIIPSGLTSPPIIIVTNGDGEITNLVESVTFDLVCPS